MAPITTRESQPFIAASKPFGSRRSTPSKIFRRSEAPGSFFRNSAYSCPSRFGTLSTVLMPLPSRDGCCCSIARRDCLSKSVAKRARVRARERATGTNANRGYGAAFLGVCQSELDAKNMREDTPEAELTPITPYVTPAEGSIRTAVYVQEMAHLQAMTKLPQAEGL